MRSLLISLAFVCNLGSATAAVTATKLNVVFILADDLGWGEVGCYGQKKIPTPNIDRLAAHGMRFTQHYSGAPTCAPARCVLMTGKHAGHAEVRGNFAVRNAFPQFTEGQNLKTKTPGPWEVYDLSKDHAEANDLAAKSPDLIRRAEDILRGEVAENPVFPVPIPGVTAAAATKR